MLILLPKKRQVSKILHPLYNKMSVVTDGDRRQTEGSSQNSDNTVEFYAKQDL